MNPSFCIRDTPSSLQNLTKFLKIKHGAQTTQGVQSHLRTYLNDQIKRYSMTKRSLHCREEEFPETIRYMLQIVDREQSFLEGALDSTYSH